MCGITGLLAFRSAETPELLHVVGRMAQAIAHRGPDDHGEWADARHGVALGHLRLSIIDVSAAGHQPMLSASGRFVLVFNGEVYNHAELRLALESEGAAPAWRGHSDTETLLAGFERWGVEATLLRCVGMFALAIWDTRERRLQLARDRFGEKPLYYGWVRGAFVFGSELKALRAHPGFAAPVCTRAVAEYLRLLYVPAPWSIHEGVYKLEPGCLLTVQDRPPETAPAQPIRAPGTHGTLSVHRWWKLAQVVEQAARAPLLDEAEAIDALEARLAEAVRLQSLADVPLGAFLSGGVDSSLIVALMQQQSVRPVQTFTVAFDDPSYDESPHAAAVARHLGTEHHELRVTSAEARSIIPELPAMYDEPFADSSQIPTHLVCRAARSQVTVALSGDAGDELFGGYNRYLWAPRVWGHVSWLHPAARRAVGGSLRVAASASEHAAVALRHVRHPAEKMRKLATAMEGAHSVDDLYRNLVACWPAPRALLQDPAGLPEGRMELPELPQAGLDGSPLRMMYWDALTYLPDDILCKVDRAAMAISLETRVPFLDHRVAELAWRLPLQMKLRAGQTKWALRQVLYRHVPRALIERPKSGFAIPLADWLRGPLREWAESLLDEGGLREQGLLQGRPIRLAWQQHLAGSHDWSHRLWSVLMFQSWRQTNSGN
jgi:asparagine synthase (glutamine-hydrolysing)